MEFKELQTKDKADLQKMLSANQEKLRDLRFKDSNKQLKNIREIRLVRQTVARILTILSKQK
ncbi:TPA: 50S ribosomal protein L29 [Candidatus Falkowbacteria bacterium]|jgi:large subunit ribosomal protein L29|nr:MAG: 50S ribosomal protein L29 [Candidatus Falkowbacteria bacterium GW2011_GWF2_43_32]HBA36977.1 50S ribosomal protein L29 [Candidatus Falkowbacteria bacterium]